MMRDYPCHPLVLGVPNVGDPCVHPGASSTTSNRRSHLWYLDLSNNQLKGTCVPVRPSNVNAEQTALHCNEHVVEHEQERSRFITKKNMWVAYHSK